MPALKINSADFRFSLCGSSATICYPPRRKKGDSLLPSALADGK